MEKAVEKIIKERAQHFSRPHVTGLEFDDLVQEGWLLYMNTVQQKYAPGRSKLTTFLYLCLTRRFCDLVRLHERRNFLPLEKTEEACCMPGAFFLASVKDLSPLAYEITEHVLSVGDASLSKGSVREHFYRRGTAYNKIARAFKEIGTFLCAQ